MALEREQATYARERPNLIGDSGKFAVICEDAVRGVYDANDDAHRVAYERVGLKPFLVVHIGLDELVRRFHRDVGVPCHT